MAFPSGGCLGLTTGLIWCPEVTPFVLLCWPQSNLHEGGCAHLRVNSMVPDQSQRAGVGVAEMAVELKMP